MIRLRIIDVKWFIQGSMTSASAPYMPALSVVPNPNPFLHPKTISPDSLIQSIK